MRGFRMKPQVRGVWAKKAVAAGLWAAFIHATWALANAYFCWREWLDLGMPDGSGMNSQAIFLNALREGASYSIPCGLATMGWQVLYGLCQKRWGLAKHIILLATAIPAISGLTRLMHPEFWSLLGTNLYVESSLLFRCMPGICGTLVLIVLSWPTRPRDSRQAA